MIHKTKEFRLLQRHNHIARKKRICNNHSMANTITLPDGRKKLDFSTNIPFDWYVHDGQYDKGKIHCSCSMCKFGCKHKLPTFRDLKERSRFKGHYNDYLEGVAFN